MEDLWLRGGVRRGIAPLRRGVYRCAVEAPVVVAIPDTVSESLKVRKACSWGVMFVHDAPRSGHSGDCDICDDVSHLCTGAKDA